MTGSTIWEQVLSRIGTKVNRHIFYTWFKPTSFVADDGSRLRIRVPNDLFRDWLTADPSVAAEYLELKRSVAAAHAGDPTSAGYAEAKEPWMAAAYDRGIAWAAATGWRPDDA